MPRYKSVITLYSYSKMTLHYLNLGEEAEECVRKYRTPDYSQFQGWSRDLLVLRWTTKVCLFRWKDRFFLSNNKLYFNTLYCLWLSGIAIGVGYQGKSGWNSLSNCLFHGLAHSAWPLDSVCHNLLLNYGNKALEGFSGFNSSSPFPRSTITWTALHRVMLM